MFFVNDVVVRKNGDISEVYAAVGSAQWDRVIPGLDGNIITLFGGGTNDGIYKSVDEGKTWEKIDLYYSAYSILSFSNYNVIPMMKILKMLAPMILPEVKVITTL